MSACSRFSPFVSLEPFSSVLEGTLDSCESLSWAGLDCAESTRGSELDDAAAAAVMDILVEGSSILRLPVPFDLDVGG